MVDPNNAPSAEALVTQADPSVDRVTIQNDPKARELEEAQRANPGTNLPTQEEAPTDPQLPEGYDSWEAYGKDVALGKVKPAEATPAEGTQEEGTQEGKLSQEQTAEVESMLGQLPEAVREKAKPVFEEFALTGTLSDDSKKAAAEAFGVTPEMVDIYMAGYQAQQTADAQSMLSRAGVSQEDFDGYRAWAETNLSVEQRMAFNEGLDKDPSKTLSDAITSWKEAGNGPGPRDITRTAPGTTVQVEAPQGYASTAEMTAAMQDPRYSKDPAYRKAVEAKVAASAFSLGRDVTNG